MTSGGKSGDGSPRCPGQMHTEPFLQLQDYLIWPPATSLISLAFIVGVLASVH